MTEDTEEQERRRTELSLDCERAKILTRDDSYEVTPWDSAAPDVGPAIWMDGVPEWACSDFPGYERSGQWDDTHVYRTAWACELFGEIETPFGWTRVITYAHSGETECLCVLDDEERDSPAYSDPECKLCDGDGRIYVGDGYREIIYRAPKGLFWPEENCTRCGHDLASFDKTADGTFDESGSDYGLCMNEACMRDRLMNVLIFHHVDADLDARLPSAQSEEVFQRLVNDILRELTPRKIGD